MPKNLERVVAFGTFLSETLHQAAGSLPRMHLPPYPANSSETFRRFHVKPAQNWRAKKKRAASDDTPSAKEGSTYRIVSTIVACVRSLGTGPVKIASFRTVARLPCWAGPSSDSSCWSLLTLVGGAHDDEFRLFLALFTRLSSATLEVNVSKHENVRRSQSLQNPSESAVISWPSRCAPR